MSLKNLRRKIDLTDKEIVKLLNRRAGYALRITSHKLKNGKSIYSPEREREVLNAVAEANNGPLKKEALESIYREIMSVSKSLGKILTIAYLGPEATNTHQAALKKFGSQVKYLSCDTIAGVFTQVEKGSADYGVVPIENSIEGAVNHTLDMFMDADLKICSQLILDITHNLLANCPKGKIRRIYSNPQVFGQCRIWLRENLPAAELIEVSSTSRAAEIAAQEKNSASISSSLAAKIYRLKVVALGIEDSPHNITRFLVIGKTDTPRTGQDRTSLMFSIKDKVGALHDMLVPFKKYRVNLSKIESRPSKKKAWDYYFFVDLQGHINDKKVGLALAELENKCKFFKVLGSYPIGE